MIAFSKVNYIPITPVAVGDATGCVDPDTSIVEFFMDLRQRAQVIVTLN